MFRLVRCSYDVSGVLEKERLVRRKKPSIQYENVRTSKPAFISTLPHVVSKSMGEGRGVVESIPVVSVIRQKESASITQQTGQRYRRALET